MKLSKLLAGVNMIHLHGSEDVEVKGLFQTCKEIEKGGMYFCYKGVNANGHDYAEEAVLKGASVLVVEQELPLNITQVVVENARIAMSQIAKNFYGAACNKLKIITVTGSNGKTSITYILSKILETAGHKCAIIGTNGTFIGKLKMNTKLTTPDPIELHYVFSQIVNLGVEFVIMEASAHAIALNKLVGINSEVAILTNVTEEHLDFFGSFEHYAEIKKSWFKQNVKNAVINADDVVGQQLLNELKVNTVSYGLSNPSDTFAINIKTSIKGSTFFVNAQDELLNIKTGLVGTYNVYNILACISASLMLGVSSETIVKGVEALKNIPGRFHVYSLDCNNVVVVDFAHTPDGFEQVLSTIKKLRSGKIFTIFGCVGYSLPKKRTEMGDIAKKYSDFVIISSDNPNFVPFKEIVADITKNYEAHEFCAIENRTRAIKFGFGKMFTDDTLVILGKGVEESNLIAGVKIKSCDTEIVEKTIEEFFNVKKSEAKS